MSDDYRAKEICVRPLLIAGLASVASLALPVLAFAQPVDQNHSDNLPSGSFIVSRPVLVRSAETPPTNPAPPHFVVLGGRDETLRAVSIGLKPLTDAEQSSVTGNVGQNLSDALAMGSSAVDGEGQRPSFQMGDMVQQRGDGAGGAVRQALGSIPSAMSALRHALGTGR